MRIHSAAWLAAWLAGWAVLPAGCRRAPPSGGAAPGRDRPTARKAQPGSQPAGGPASGPVAARSRGYRIAHVFVCLCDNAHQGIVPVPKALGNGQDPKSNLYWGAMYGVKTFLRRSPHWRQIAGARVALGADAGAVLDTAVFELAGRPKTYLLAEAFDGAKMPSALQRFFEAAAGRLARVAAWGRGERQTVVRAGGAADVVCFVGHNGLMDHRLSHAPRRAAGAAGPARAIVLACKSRDDFVEPLRRAGCSPLITTSGLMAPEAYTLDAALRSWAAGEPAATTHLRAARAYATYQKCSLSAAKRLFVTPAAGRELPAHDAPAPRGKPSGSGSSRQRP